MTREMLISILILGAGIWLLAMAKEIKAGLAEHDAKTSALPPEVYARLLRYVSFGSALTLIGFVSTLVTLTLAVVSLLTY